MAKPTVYIETTVISYLTARQSRDLIVAAHQQLTYEWWGQVLPRCHPYISPVVIAEIQRGDSAAAERRLKSIEKIPVLELTVAIQQLAEEYFLRTRIPHKARADAFHLAFATLHGIDYLVSWNFAHILSAPVRALVQEINSTQSLRTPVICTPEEAMEV